VTGPVKAYLETEIGDRIDCLFNPSQLIIDKKNTWFPPPVQGKDAPKLAFRRGNAGTLDMTLMLDTTDTGQPVTNYTTALLELMKVNPDLSDSSDPSSKTGRPPWVRFNWGQLISFKAVITSLKITFTFFGTDGTPLRASAAISLQQFRDEGEWPLQNPTSGTPNPHTIHQVSAGETLDRIATVRYGDPSRWRLIAEANHILDPLRIEPGTLLVIPRAETVTRG
jgi:hypothetical protein